MADAESQYPSLFEELKRRRVVRVALVYGAAAFAVIQAADVIFPRIPLPDWAVSLVVWLAILGFPVALALSWAFDLTPAGMQRTRPGSATSSVEPAESAESLEKDGGRPTRSSARLRLRAAVVGLAAVAVFAAVALGLHGRRGAMTEAAPALSSHVLAVLPFEVRGSESIAYLGEGIVDLLSAKLSGADGLQTVDPRTLLGFLAREGGLPTDERGTRVAQLFGARYFVLGSVVEFRGEMQIRASLYETGPQPRLLLEAGASGRDDDLFRLIDELAAQLVASRAVGASARLARLAAVTTDSLRALKAYLAGERAYRGLEFLVATEHFQDALRIDSTFALAGYRLAAAAIWEQRPDLVQRGLEIGLRHSTRLGERERLLLEAQAADELDHDYARADSLYRQFLLTYRDEPDAWYRIGEVVLHHGPFLGYRRQDAREPFERALAFDPDLGPALYHAVNLAADRGDTVALDTLVRRFQRLATDPRDSLFTTVDWIFFHADTARYAWAERQLAVTAEPVNGFYAHEAALLTLERDPATARRLWTVMATRSPSAPVRAWGYAGLADVEAARGRFAAAEAELDRAERLDPALALQQRVQLALHPLHDPPADVLRRLRDRISRWEPAGVSAATGTLQTVQFAREGAVVRLYLLGLLDARTGNLAGARRLVREIRAAPATDLAVRESLALLLDAEVARREDRVEEALRLLEAAPVWRRRSARLQMGTLTFTREGFDRAELLRATGRPGEAAHWYAVLSDAQNQLLYRAPALYRLCQLHEAAGEVAQARDACRRFVALWRDADPGLQPVVAEARQRLARLERR